MLTFGPIQLDRRGEAHGELPAKGDDHADRWLVRAYGSRGLAWLRFNTNPSIQSFNAPTLVQLAAVVSSAAVDRAAAVGQFGPLDDTEWRLFQAWCRHVGWRALLREVGDKRAHWKPDCRAVVRDWLVGCLPMEQRLILDRIDDLAIVGRLIDLLKERGGTLENVSIQVTNRHEPHALAVGSRLGVTIHGRDTVVRAVLDGVEGGACEWVMESLNTDGFDCWTEWLRGGCWR